MEERLNPQPLPPRHGVTQVEIPVDLLKLFTVDARFVHGPIAGMLMLPPELLGDLQAKLGEGLAVMVVSKAEIQQ
jgi:hypothetical protein